MRSILFDILQLALKKFIKPSKVEETGGFPQEESGTHRINFVEHRVVVYGQLFKNPHQKVIGVVFFAESMVVHNAVLFAYV